MTHTFLFLLHKLLGIVCIINASIVTAVGHYTNFAWQTWALSESLHFHLNLRILKFYLFIYLFVCLFVCLFGNFIWNYILYSLNRIYVCIVLYIDFLTRFCIF